MPNGSYSLAETATRRGMLGLTCSARGRRGQYRVTDCSNATGRILPSPICATGSRNARAAAACRKPCQVEYASLLDA